MSQRLTNYDDPAWQFALDAANRQAKEAFDRIESGKLARDPKYNVQAFVTETLDSYTQRMVDLMGAGYATRQKREQTTAHMAIIEAQDAATIARLAKAAALPPGAERDGLAAAVDALPS